MSRTTMVNYENLFIAGNNFEESSESIKSVIENIESATSDLAKCWMGYDADIFITKMNNYSIKTTNMNEYLSIWSNYFKKSSKNYNYMVDNNVLEANKMNNNITMEEKKDEIR